MMRAGFGSPFGAPGLCAAVLLVVASGVALAQTAPAGDAGATHPREKTLTKRVWGVEVIGLRQLAAGRMVEFRYKVLDEAKAQPLFVRKTDPELRHEASGAKLRVARNVKLGPLRSTDPPQKGRVYWMLFDNSGGVVKPGDNVTVVIGEFRAEGLVVE